jgi:hypothetical protein
MKKVQLLNFCPPFLNQFNIKQQKITVKDLDTNKRVSLTLFDDLVYAFADLSKSKFLMIDYEVRSARGPYGPIEYKNVVDLRQMDLEAAIL